MQVLALPGVIDRGRPAAGRAPASLLRRSRPFGRAAAWTLFLTLLAGLPGCSTLEYYGQSLAGQLDLLARRRPISEILDDPARAPRLREVLARVLEVRDFATRALGLPDNASYRSYAAIDRPYLVWSVVAAPALSLDPVTWCFPVVGCVAYRGYFHAEDARGLARELAGQGLDVSVSGVAAYSTLGWFDDPLPSTVIDWPEYRIAGLIFHELAHQRLYVKGDSAFNEAFATTVARAGVRRWLAAYGSDGQRAAYRREQAEQALFLGLVEGARGRARALYASSLPEEYRRLGKARVLADLRDAYRARRADFTASRYEHWFGEGLNNARLASVLTYYDLVPGLEALLRDRSNDLNAFYAACERLATLPKSKRRERLLALVLAAGAPGPPDE